MEIDGRVSVGIRWSRVDSDDLPRRRDPPGFPVWAVRPMAPSGSGHCNALARPYWFVDSSGLLGRLCALCILCYHLSDVVLQIKFGFKGEVPVHDAGGGASWEGIIETERSGPVQGLFDRLGDLRNAPHTARAGRDRGPALEIPAGEPVGDFEHGLRGVIHEHKFPPFLACSPQGHRVLIIFHGPANPLDDGRDDVKPGRVAPGGGAIEVGKKDGDGVKLVLQAILSGGLGDDPFGDAIAGVGFCGAPRPQVLDAHGGLAGRERAGGGDVYEPARSGPVREAEGVEAHPQVAVEEGHGESHVVFNAAHPAGGEIDRVQVVFMQEVEAGFCLVFEVAVGTGVEACGRVFFGEGPPEHPAGSQDEVRHKNGLPQVSQGKGSMMEWSQMHTPWADSLRRSITLCADFNGKWARMQGELLDTSGH